MGSHIEFHTITATQIHNYGTILFKLKTSNIIDQNEAPACAAM